MKLPTIPVKRQKRRITVVAAMNCKLFCQQIDPSWRCTISNSSPVKFSDAQSQSEGSIAHLFTSNLIHHEQLEHGHCCGSNGKSMPANVRSCAHHRRWLRHHHLINEKADLHLKHFLLHRSFFVDSQWSITFTATLFGTESREHCEWRNIPAETYGDSMGVRFETRFPVHWNFSEIASNSSPAVTRSFPGELRAPRQSYLIIYSNKWLAVPTRRIFGITSKISLKNKHLGLYGSQWRARFSRNLGSICGYKTAGNRETDD